MTSIIQGRELSLYKTIALTLGKSKKENREKKLSRFVVISMKDAYSPLSKSLNPYFNGTCSKSFTNIKATRKMEKCLNPYFNGTCSKSYLQSIA